MTFYTPLTRAFQLRIPVIMAPMFLVSNEKMVESAMDFGIIGTFPTLNYREDGQLKAVLDRLNAYRKTNACPGNYGVNLIVQKTNPLYKKHLEDCVKAEVPLYITSLGHPGEVIIAAHGYGGKVYCDVTNLEHAEKCAKLGCDGFIAVTQGAGGHAGPYPASVLIPALRKAYPSIPVIAAGGIASGDGILSALALGAAGVSMGTRFIASKEAAVSNEYKKAIVDAGMEDIMMTERLSGTPCAVIRTPFAEKIGEKQHFIEKWLSTNRRTKKYFKMLVQLRGFKKLEAAIQPGNYRNLWSAGQSVALIDEVLSCKEILERLEEETIEAFQRLQKNCGQ